jgi:hypothetical protein
VRRATSGLTLASTFVTKNQIRKNMELDDRSKNVLKLEKVGDIESEEEFATKAAILEKRKFLISQSVNLKLSIMLDSI